MWRGTLKTEGTQSKPAGFAWLPQGALCCRSCCVGALQIHLCYLQSETLFMAGLSTHIYKYKMAQEKVLTSTNHLCSYLYSSLLPLTSAISCTYLFNFKEEHLLKEKTGLMCQEKERLKHCVAAVLNSSLLKTGHTEVTYFKTKIFLCPREPMFSHYGQ